MEMCTPRPSSAGNARPQVLADGPGCRWAERHGTPLSRPDSGAGAVTGAVPPAGASSHGRVAGRGLRELRARVHPGEPEDLSRAPSRGPTGRRRCAAMASRFTEADALHGNVPSLWSRPVEALCTGARQVPSQQRSGGVPTSASGRSTEPGGGGHCPGHWTSAPAGTRTGPPSPTGPLPSSSTKVFPRTDGLDTVPVLVGKRRRAGRGCCPRCREVPARTACPFRRALRRCTIHSTRAPRQR